MSKRSVDVRVEWEDDFDGGQHWLFPGNIKYALEKCCPNTKFYCVRELPKHDIPRIGYEKAKEIILQAIGHASVCWNKDGVFNSEQALKVGMDLLSVLGIKKEDDT